MPIKILLPVYKPLKPFILHKMSEDSPIEKIQTAQTALDTELSEIRKWNAFLIKYNEIVEQLTEIDGNSRDFYSNVKF